MSLSRLPDQLKADICSYLDYKDIIKLAQVNKGILNSLKNLELDKPKAERVTFELKELIKRGGKTKEFVRCEVRLKNSNSSDYLEPAHFEHQKEKGSFTARTVDLINKFNSIRRLEFESLILHEHSGFDEIETKMWCGTFVDCGFWIPRSTFLKFLKRFKYIEFITVYTNGSYINDEFFTELTDNGTSVEFNFWRDRGPLARLNTEVTDATLDILSRKGVPHSVQFSTLITKFSFKRIKKFMEDGFASEAAGIWNFGFLKSDEYEEVHRFCTEEFAEWARTMPYNLEIHSVDTDHWYRGRTPYVQEYERYQIFDPEEDFQFLLIVISVFKPMENVEERAEEVLDYEEGEEMYLQDEDERRIYQYHEYLNKEQNSDEENDELDHDRINPW